MLRAVLVALCRLLLRIFFRQIEVVGKHHLPPDGAVLFALNHPSGLIDPLFILCLSERRVSFLAKEPLFRMPIVGFFVKAFESLPVYRSRDGGDPEKNRTMMRAASDLLAKGNALALFPEGTSHSDPSLKRFRSGAARIALAARALSGKDVYLVPGALYYENKQIFRSRAVLALGAPFGVPLVELNDAGDSSTEIGQELTARLQTAISQIMPTAETVDGLVLAEKAERVLSAALRDTPELCPRARQLVARSCQTSSGTTTLADRMWRRRYLIDGYLRLSQRSPHEVERLIERISHVERTCQDAGLRIDALPGKGKVGHAQLLRWALIILVLSPLALPGLLLHGPTYQLIRWIAFRYSQETDVTATVKLLSGFLLFPVTWLGVAGGLSLYFGDLRLLAVALLGPPMGFSALLFSETLSVIQRRLTSREPAVPGFQWQSLLEERARVAEEMATLLRQMEQTEGSSPPGSLPALEPSGPT